LCCREQGREQVRVAHRGQVYFAGVGQCAHVEEEEAVEGDVDEVGWEGSTGAGRDAEVVLLASGDDVDGAWAPPGREGSPNDSGVGSIVDA
jgi:hypothetical protein